MTKRIPIIPLHYHIDAPFEDGAINEPLKEEVVGVKIANMTNAHIIVKQWGKAAPFFLNEEVLVESHTSILVDYTDSLYSRNIKGYVKDFVIGILNIKESPATEGKVEIIILCVPKKETK